MDRETLLNEVIHCLREQSRMENIFPPPRLNMLANDIIKSMSEECRCLMGRLLK